MWLELRTLVDGFAQDPNVRAIVFSGAGPRGFTAGLDIKAASTGLLSPSPSSSSSSSGQSKQDAARIATRLRRQIADFQDCVSALERCPKPVVCLLHGVSFGLAIDLASATDIRLCARDTQFSVKEVDIGLAADVGTLSRLPKVVGNYGWVKEVCLSARVFGAEEASRVGFVNEVCESKEEMVRKGLELAGGIAAKSPVAVQGTKELLDYSRDHGVQDGLRYTAAWNGGMLQTGDVAAALTSGLEKRTPRFEKL